MSVAEIAAMSLEAMVEHAIAMLDERDLAGAREVFHARTGPFEPGEPFYEERVRAFFDWALVEHRQGALLRALLPRLGAAHRELAIAMMRSMRSLYRVGERERHGQPVLQCMLGGARFEVRRDDGPAARLRPGDVLDGRLVGTRQGVLLAPGPIFHPREAHEAIERLLAEAQAAHRRDATLLDPLLRMRMRFDRFASIHARHVYRYDAIDRTEILAAPWAQRTASP